MRAARLASVVPFVTLVAATTACTVSDKFLAYDANPGDDTIDASTDPDGGVDTTPPETTLTSTPPADDDSGSATFEFEADEPATFKCSVDGESAVDCTSPYTRTLADGPHTFSVRAIDTSGNQDETPAEHTWNIDTVAPDTTIVQGPAAIDNSTDVEFTFSSNEANVTFECNLDGAGFSTCTTPASFTGLTDGNHTFQVRAKDAAGNVDASPAMHAWMIDTSTPDTTIDSGPLGAVSATDALFSFSSPDAGPGATFECALDGAAFAGCTSPKSYTSLTEATHMFQVRVRDAGGNVDPSPALRMWTVDRTPPNTSLTAPIISGYVASTSANIAFTSNEAGSTFQCSQDGAAYNTCTSPKALSGLAQGAHTFAVRAIDAAGNQDATPASASWTVDTVAPDTSFASGPPAIAGSSTAAFSLSATESPVTYECKLDTGTYAACDTPFSITVGDGSHTEYARAKDAAGNQDSTPATFAWIADTTPPVLTISSGPADGSTSGPYTTFVFSSNEPGSFTCIIDGTSSSCTSPTSYSLPEGPHTFEVRSTDQAGNTGNATRGWSVACSAPGAQNGAVGVFHFDEAPGVQTASNAVNAALSAFLGETTGTDLSDPSESVAGRFGTAYQFVDLDRDTVEWAANTTVSKFSIAFWVRPTQNPAGSPQDFVTTNAFAAINDVAIYQSANPGLVRIEYQIVDGAGTYQYLFGPVITASEWHYVVATYDGTTAALWVDGVATTKAVTHPGTFDLGTVVFGSSLNGTLAKLDEMVVANQGWTSAQVLGSYCPLPATPVVPACPANYQTVAGLPHKYRASAVSSSWTSARTACAADLPGYTYLAVPDNGAENGALANNLGGGKWIGIDDIPVNNQWRTVFGSQPGYFNWDAAEPTGGQNNACVWFNGQGFWRDDPCGGISNQYICECDGQ